MWPNSKKYYNYIYKEKFQSILSQSIISNLYKLWLNRINIQKIKYKDSIQSVNLPVTADPSNIARRPKSDSRYIYNRYSYRKQEKIMAYSRAEISQN